MRAERERWFGEAPWRIDMYPEYGDPLERVRQELGPDFVVTLRDEFDR